MRLRDFALVCSAALASYCAMTGDTKEPTATATVDGFGLSGYADGRINLSRSGVATRQLGGGVIRAIERVSERMAAVVQRKETTFLELPSLRTVSQAPALMGSMTPTVFLTEEDTDSHRLNWFTWPSVSPICRLVGDHPEGVERAQFAPNLRYAAVFFDSRYPFPDDAFPVDPSRFERDRTTPFMVELYDLSHCERSATFAQRRLPSPGRFSSDSAFYEVPDPRGTSYPSRGRFDLISQRWEDENTASRAPERDLFVRTRSCLDSVGSRV
jgi:hypothetical protein